MWLKSESWGNICSCLHVVEKSLHFIKWANQAHKKRQISLFFVIKFGQDMTAKNVKICKELALRQIY